MTDKQIMINDVDVSRCNYFNNTDKSYCEECCSEFGCAICNDRPNCYYKQLARKEEECEELKETLAEIKEIAKQGIDSKEFMIVQCMLNGSVDDKNKVLKQILQKSANAR